MKKLILLSVFSVAFLFANAQNDSTKSDEFKTIIGKNTSNGGYFGLTGGYSVISGKQAGMFGTRLGWIINHNFVIGIAGNGFVNDLKFDYPNGNQYFLTGGYGGLLLEFCLGPKKPIHVSFPLVIGVGGVAYNNFSYDAAIEDYNLYTEDADAYTVIEPGVELELNMMKHLRLGFGASYRFTSDVHITGHKSGLMNGLTVGMTMKLGKF